MKTRISFIQSSKITPAFLCATALVATYFVGRVVFLGLQALQMIDAAWQVGLN